MSRPKKEVLSRRQIAEIAAEVAARAALDSAVAASAESGVKAAIAAYEQEQVRVRKVQADRRLRNTQLLLRKYRLFKKYCDNAVYQDDPDPEDEDGNAMDILNELEDYDEDFYVESIRRSVKRTRIILRHIDRMLDVYDTMCSSSSLPEEKRRGRIIRARFVDDNRLTVREIADQEHITTSTAYKDINVGCGVLCTLFFGIDGLNVK